MADVRDLAPGAHVVARNAFNELRPATLCPVPRSERDRTGSATWTTRGRFPKVWVRFDRGRNIPWPIEDVFTDMDSAKASQAEHAGD